MESFHWVTGSLALVLSLGLTRLLTTLVRLFRARGRVKMDWVPFVRAVCIFYSMPQLSWAASWISSRAHPTRL